MQNLGAWSRLGSKVMGSGCKLWGWGSGVVVGVRVRNWFRHGVRGRVGDEVGVHLGGHEAVGKLHELLEVMVALALTGHLLSFDIAC